MGLLVNLLLYALIFGLVAYLIRMAPIDGRFKTIALYVLLVVFVIVLINLLAGGLAWGPLVVVR